MREQYQAIIDIILDGGASCVFHSMDEREVEDILRWPLTSICSDSGVRAFGVGMPHPRGYGSNARVLGRYVRERHIIPLEDAVRKMTSLPATAFRLQDRGLLRPGYFADINIFDPEKVTDRATFDKPHQYSEGFRAVIVNGKVEAENDQITGALGGMPLYGPGHK
jgi:N-acyl-D-amino-acid deacylase